MQHLLKDSDLSKAQIEALGRISASFACARGTCCSNQPSRPKPTTQVSTSFRRERREVAGVAEASGEFTGRERSG